MTRKALLSIAIFLAMGGVSWATIFSGGPRYDGTVKILQLTGTSCPSGQLGQVFPAVYRAKFKPTQINEAMSISFSVLAGAVFIVAQGDGTFSGTDQVVDANLILNAARAAVPQGTVNFRFNPNPVTETTTHFTFSGVYKNYTFANCVAKVRGVFTKR
jgi:hypothetical protein